MAYLTSIDDQNEEEGLQSPGAAKPSIAPAAGGAAAPGGGPESAPVSSPSKFVNFSQYLNANKDLSSKTSGQVGASLTAGAEGARNSLADTQEEFKKRVAGGSLTYGGNQIGTSGVEPVYGARPTFNGATSGVVGTYGGEPMTPSEDARAKSKQTYTGPDSLSGVASYQDLAKKTADAQAKVGGTGTEGGLQTLLKDQYGSNGDYSKGANSMDAALVGATGRKQFENLRSKYGGLTQALEGANTASAGVANAARTSTAAAATRYGADADAEDKRKADASAKADADATRQHQEADEDKTWHEVGAMLQSKGITAEDLSGAYGKDLQRQIDERYGAGTWAKYQAAAKRHANVPQA